VLPQVTTFTTGTRPTDEKLLERYEAGVVEPQLAAATGWRTMVFSFSGAARRGSLR
jgi:hypothetical protein